MAAGFESLKPPLKLWIKSIKAVTASAFSLAFAVSSFSYMLNAFSADEKIGIIPNYLVIIIMPLGFLLMGIQFILKTDHNRRTTLVMFVCAFVIGLLLALSSIINILDFFYTDLPLAAENMLALYDAFFTSSGIIIIIILIIFAFLGLPVFIVLGGIAYILFASSRGALEAIPEEAYALLISDTIPTIPLFAFAGFILSESRAGERLIRFFRALLGWLPGGLAIMAVIVCAFFTIFTGASGITILALGALLTYVLTGSGKYSPEFSNGLITASGSIGLLFPPSLPVIFYGVVYTLSSEEMFLQGKPGTAIPGNIFKELFIGGIIPGLLLVLTLSIFGIIAASKKKVKPDLFSLKELVSALLDAGWEILFPFVLMFLYITGFVSLSKLGAVAVLYVLVVEVFIKKELKLKQLSSIIGKSIPVVGGILIIMALARGLSGYIIDAEIATKLASWVVKYISSKTIFLMLLNTALLITGCFMDIFSATMVVVPLLIPLGQVYHIHPVHLGIIFLANLELGYLTPPVGLNLFLASYTFKQPLTRIYKNVFPFFIALLIIVLLITYIPALSTGLLSNAFPNN
jgi:tripartite ATP-independent transporter DctM subunit